MGAIFEYRRYRDGDRAVIEQNWQDAVDQSRYADGHSYSGAIGMLGGRIQWKDVELPTEAEAEDYLEERHQKWNPPMAVSFVTEGQKYWLIGGSCSS